MQQSMSASASLLMKLRLHCVSLKYDHKGRKRGGGQIVLFGSSQAKTITYEPRKDVENVSLIIIRKPKNNDYLLKLNNAKSPSFY